MCLCSADPRVKEFIDAWWLACGGSSEKGIDFATYLTVGMQMAAEVCPEEESDALRVLPHKSSVWWGDLCMCRRRV